MVTVQISKKSFKKRKKKKRTVHNRENNSRIGRTVQESKRSPNLQQEISLAKSKLALISRRNAGTVELLQGDILRAKNWAGHPAQILVERR